MIVPVRCFTCGKVLCDKWNAYVAALESADADEPERGEGEVTVGGGDENEGGASGAGSRALVPKSRRGEILDRMQITKLCCRRHMLSNVDLMDLI